MLNDVGRYKNKQKSLKSEVIPQNQNLLFDSSYLLCLNAPSLFELYFVINFWQQTKFEQRLEDTIPWTIYVRKQQVLSIQFHLVVSLIDKLIRNATMSLATKFYWQQKQNFFFQQSFYEPDDAEITTKLPREILLRIFSYLDVVSLCRCAQVNCNFFLQRHFNSTTPPPPPPTNHTTIPEQIHFIGEQILEHSRIGWLELAENWFIWFSTRHWGMWRPAQKIFPFHLPNHFSLSDSGTSYREYLPKMRWIFKIFVIERMSIGCGSIVKVKFASGENIFRSIHIEYHYRTLALHCHNIERLDLSDCKKITDHSTSAISKHCHKLISINLESCVNITDMSLKSISDGCPVCGMP